VTAIQNGAAPAVESAEVRAGANTTVVLKISPLAVPVASAVDGRAVTAAPSAGLVAAPSGPRSSRGWWLGRKWTWVAAGSTVLLTGAAAIVGHSVNSRYDELAGTCGSTKTGCSDGDLSALRARKDTANVLWGLAAAAAVTSGVLFFVEGRPVAMAPMAGDATGMVARVGF
jgi:hypothetical protein